MKKYLCEFLGTCVLVLFGCGVAVLTNADIVATSLAFGLSIVACAYVIGNVSGCHVNPAVSFAMWIDKRITFKEFILYTCSQVIGAIAGSGLLVLILNATSLGDYHTIGLGANAFGTAAGSEITLLGALVVEIILTFVFVLSVLGVTKEEKNSSVAPIVIGLTLAFVHVLGIKLTGTSVNPARSLGPAIWLQGVAIKQVWVFVVAPFVGAAFAALVSFFIDLDSNKEVEAIFDIEKVEANEKVEVKETKKENVVKANDKKDNKTSAKKNTKTNSKSKTTKTSKK
jgi:aquaporin Z